MNKIIILIATAITIGLATVSLVKSLINDLIMPLLFTVFVKGTKKISGQASNVFQKVIVNKGLHFANFITEVITWFLIVFFAVFISKHLMTKIPFLEKFEYYPVDSETKNNYL